MGCCCSYLLQHSGPELLQRGVCSEWSVESPWVWPTLIIFHSIFDTIGESYRPFVLTLLLVVCQNVALTHPNFYLRLGLLSSKKTQHETISPLKTNSALTIHYFTSSVLQLQEVGNPTTQAMNGFALEEMVPQNAAVLEVFQMSHGKVLFPSLCLSPNGALCLYFGRTHSCFIDGPVTMICSSSVCADNLFRSWSQSLISSG